MKTVWILISWLRQKPADLDLHYFLKRVWHFEKVKYIVCLTLILLNQQLSFFENTADPDQLASDEAI